MAADLSTLALSDNGFLFDSSTGQTYTLNSTGTFILRKLIGGSGKKDILAGLLDEYDVTEDTASHDLDRFLDHLSGLLHIHDLAAQADGTGGRQEA